MFINLFMYLCIYDIYPTRSKAANPPPRLVDRLMEGWMGGWMDIDRCQQTGQKVSGCEKQGPGTKNIDFQRSGERKYCFVEVWGAKILIFRGPGIEHIDF